MQTKKEGTYGGLFVTTKKYANLQRARVKIDIIPILPLALTNKIPVKQLFLSQLLVVAPIV
jgi:hypothetical protein